MSFAARLENTGPVTGLLSCLVDARKSEQAAHWLVDGLGVRVHVVGRGKASSSTLTLPKSWFAHFTLRDEHGVENLDSELIFSLDVATLVDCLHLFGSGASDGRAVTLTYEPSDAVLKLMLEEQGVYTCCDVHVLDIDSAVDMVFEDDEQLARLIADSASLKDVVAEFDESLTGAATIRLDLSRDAPNFRLAASGGLGAVEVDVPRTVFAAFDPPQIAVSFGYQRDAFLAGMRPLAHSDQTCVALNARGMLKAQHVLPGRAGQDPLCFDYVCSSADLDDDGNHDFPSSRGVFDATFSARRNKRPYQDDDMPASPTY